jgi:hypothetical protein
LQPVPLEWSREPRDLQKRSPTGPACRAQRPSAFHFTNRRICRNLAGRAMPNSCWRFDMGGIPCVGTGARGEHPCQGTAVDTLRRVIHPRTHIRVDRGNHRLSWSDSLSATGRLIRGAAMPDALAAFGSGYLIWLADLGVVAFGSVPKMSAEPRPKFPRPRTIQLQISALAGNRS